jgi:hypothetical protein
MTTLPPSLGARLSWCAIEKPRVGRGFQIRSRQRQNLERETRLELATPTLARPGYPSTDKDLLFQQGTNGTPSIKDLPQ